ncbi:MAG TPA: ADOP family duplicated permease [Candidatus Baltobacteraceae bacterium]|jgi:putative ABC transport system permease protein|nr:ADOP family duplicated permease [Candidatus Baltobacteraceae bacterium]
MHGLLYAACLAYPGDFRKNYRTQIVNDFELRRRTEGTGAAFLLRLLADIITTGLSMRAENLARDVGNALRRLRKTKLMAVVIVITFALGIGANVGVFSVLDAILLAPLPYPNADRVLNFALSDVHSTSGFLAMSLPDVIDLQQRSVALRNVAGFMEDGKTLTGFGKPRSLNVSDVTYAFFDVLGTRSQAGRFFSSGDARSQNPDAIVISDRLWRSTFAGNPNVVGRRVLLDGTSYQIIGVAPPGFESPAPELGSFFNADVWTLFPQNSPLSRRGARDLSAIGSIKAGFTPQSARADMQRVLDQLRRRYPRYYRDWVWSIRPLRDALVGAISPAALWAAYAAAAGVFLIMCANIAGLLLTQSNARTHELSLRLALGASRKRIASQLLTESGVLAVLGGAVGLAIAFAALRVFAGLAAAQIPRLGSIRIDLPIVAYAIAIVGLATVVAGSAPAWILAFSAPLRAIKAAGRSGSRAAGKGFQSVLVVAELALALALVTSSGLAIRSFYGLTHADLGIRTSGLLVTDIYAIPARRFPTIDAKRALLHRLDSALTAIAGPRVALGSNYPTSNASIQMSLRISGQPSNGNAIAALASVSPAYFDTLGISLERGRIFAAGDTSSAAPVAIVNGAFSRLLRARSNPLGTRIQIAVPNQPGPPVWRTIVGQVSDDRDGPTAVAQPTVYLPLDQAVTPWITAIVAAPDSAAMRSKIEGAFASLDPAAEPPPVESIAQRLGEEASGARLSAALLTVLAAIALCLAIAGIFAVVSYSVSQRFQEFGIRMAVGSSAVAVVRNVLGGIAVLIAAGVAIGLVLAAAAGRAIVDQLYQVKPVDPLVLLSVTVLLVASALVAALLPALRAARIDPAAALRYE